MRGLGPEDFAGTSRFFIECRIGAGGFGVVYQAYDRERHTRVALKTLRFDEPDALYLFKREFRALADVSHTNLVQLYELMSEDGEWFFTMELVDGTDFLTYVRTRAASKPEIGPQTLDQDSDMTVAPDMTTHSNDTLADREDTAQILDRKRAEATRPGLGGVLNHDRLQPALCQVIRGVSSLHRAGKIHRDIKPSNILVSHEGRVVILDFGLIAEASVDSLSNSMQLSGTPAYVSPEQIAEGHVSEASDWYSMGVMLFEALTGRLPFSGQGVKLLMDKVRIDARAPREFDPDIPDHLNDLCVALLQRDPRRRPTARDMLRRLGGLGTRSRRSVRTNGGGQPAGASAPFVGRDRHMSVLRGAFESARQGMIETVYVHGGSGMGKSALVGRFLDDIRGEHTESVILQGRCYERESVPYKALDSLVDTLSQFLRHLPQDQIADVIPPDVHALAQLFPTLQRVGAIAAALRREVAVTDSQELRRRAVMALRDLLSRLAGARPVVLFVDDLQWGDADSAALLAELMRPPDPPALLFIASYRTEEAETNPLLRALLAALRPGRAGDEAAEVVVEQLDFGDARALARALLAGDSPKAQALASIIAREAGGNPYFIDEFVRYSTWTPEPADHRDGGSYQPIPSLETLGTTGSGGATLDEVINDRVSRLPEAARALLHIVCVAGKPLDLDLALKTAGLASDELAALVPLQAGRLLRTRYVQDCEQIEPYHDRIRETVVGGLEPAELASCNRRLAVALESSGVADPETLTAYFEGAGEVEKAAQYAVAAGDSAAATHAVDLAVRLYRRALALYAADRPERFDLIVKLGDSLVNAGRGAEAADAYLAAAGDQEAGNVELERRAAEHLLRSGYIDRGLEVMRTVLGRVGMEFAKTPRHAVLSVARRRLWLKIRGQGYKLRPESQIPPELLLRIDVCWAVMVGLALVDSVQWLDFMTRHLLYALEAGEPRRIARALSSEGPYSARDGVRSRKRTDRLVETAMDLARQLDNPEVLGLATLMAGLAAFMECRYTPAADQCERAESILHGCRQGLTWEHDNAQYFFLRSLFHLGRLEELARRLPAPLRDARARGNLYAETALRIRVSHVVALMDDDPETASREVAESVDRWSRQGFYTQHYWAMHSTAEIALYRGDGSGALAALDAQWLTLAERHFLRVQAQRIELYFLRARAAVASAVERGKAPAEKERLLKAAGRDADQLDREGSPVGQAMATLIRASVSAASGKQEKAEALMASAEAGFEAADMLLLAAAARRGRGTLAGGGRGEGVVADADAWMRAQKVSNPARMAAMFVPWSPDR